MGKGFFDLDEALEDRSCRGVLEPGFWEVRGSVRGWDFGWFDDFDWVVDEEAGGVDVRGAPRSWALTKKAAAASRAEPTPARVSQRATGAGKLGETDSVEESGEALAERPA